MTPEVESNQTKFELIFIKFFKYFLPFRSNQIANFRIESNEFQFDSTPKLHQSLPISFQTLTIAGVPAATTAEAGAAAPSKINTV